MTAINVSSEDGIVILRLDRPPVNALDIETLDALSDRLDEARGNDVDALVITGTGGMFSAGADLRKVLAGDPSEIDQGIDSLTRNFRTLFTFPRPIVAAVNGFALAGGAVITCGCDHRLMGRTGAIGAIELSAGVPFPSWALELVRHNVPAGHFQEVVLLGRAYESEDALRIGLVDEIVDDERLMPRALEVARELARVPRATYAHTKAMARGPSVELADRVARETDEAIKQAWRSDEVHAAIRRQLEALRGRRPE
jgi:enoyl-CoA hydratase